MQTRILRFQFGDPRLQRRHCRLDQFLDSASRVRPCHSSLTTDVPRLTNISLSGAINGYRRCTVTERGVVREHLLNPLELVPLNISFMLAPNQRKPFFRRHASLGFAGLTAAVLRIDLRAYA